MTYEWLPHGSVTDPKGFTAAAAAAGIKVSGAPDLALILCEKTATAAAVFTKNRVESDTVTVCRRHAADGSARAFIDNSGNANCCTPDGLAVAEGICAATAAALGLAPQDVLPASTGIIGESLPLAPIEKALPTLVANLSATGGIACAEAIMTTDTVPKHRALTYTGPDGATITLGAIAKGSGMIHPNMGTMHALITTDATITAPLLKKALCAAVDDSFNMISIDGDTSTNDTVAIMASGLAKAPAITLEDEAYRAFAEALKTLCIALAKDIAADGEGASQLLICQVLDAASTADARQVAKSVISSSLVKTAIYGGDANWGRIICACGYAGVPIDPAKIDITVKSGAGFATVCEKGRATGISRREISYIFKQPPLTLEIKLGQGKAEAEAYGCDLTERYVAINAEYEV